MPGYLILPDEAYDWSGDQPDKVRPHPTRLGLFDLVRAFEQDPFPFDRLSPGICLTGLGELLVTMNQSRTPTKRATGPISTASTSGSAPSQTRSATWRPSTSPSATNSRSGPATTFSRFAQGNASRFGASLAATRPSAPRLATARTCSGRICREADGGWWMMDGG